jgi:AsmA family protein
MRSWAGFALKSIAKLLAVLALFAVVVMMFYDWNALRPLIEDRLSETLRRQVDIQGPLEVRPRFTAHLVANDVRLANAPWAREPFMLEAERAHVSLRLLPLVFGRFEIVRAGFADASLALERGLEGEKNWDFMPEREEDEAPPGFERLEFERVAVSYDDHGREGVIRGGVERLALETEEDTGPVAVSGTGHVEQRPFSLDAEFGALSAIGERDTRYPAAATLTFGEQSIRIAGETGPGRTLEGSRFKLDAEGSALHDDLGALRIELGPLPPYQASAVVEAREEGYRVLGLLARIGDSQIAGEGTMSLDPPGLRAQLRLPRLHMPDFEGLRREEGPGPELLEQPLPVELLRRAGAVLDVRVDTVTGGADLLERLASARFALALAGGVLRVSPLTADVSQGQLEAYVTLDANPEPATLNARLAMSGVRLEQVLEPLADEPFVEHLGGGVGASAELSAQGGTPRDMLESLGGAMGLAMSGGSMSYVLDRLAALDLAGVARWLAGDDEPIELECMISIFDLREGVARPRLMLLASEDTDIWGEGEVNLLERTIDMELVAEPHDLGIGVLRSPIRIQGELSAPEVRPAPGPLAARGAAAVALGALAAPIAALLGTLTTGPGQENICGEYAAAIRKIKEGEVPERSEVPEKGELEPG